MSAFDAIVLARIQFALNISFHILFPAITIGLAWLLLYFRVRFTLGRNEAWEYAYYFWVKVFALTFALGVVSGVTMSFQFGTNWPGFIERTGNISGPLLGYEVLTAFFIEATFLAIMLFGKDRVSNGTHLASAALVAFGTTLSAFWILSLNSWMQTPQGHEIVDGKFYAVDWLAVIFNPSFPYRFAHMTVASLLTSAFLIAGVSAGRMIRRVDGPATALVLRTGVLLAAVLAPLQVLLGDLHGLNTLEHQPAKIAAIEGIWETQAGAPFTILGWPDEDARTTRFALEIPLGSSLILTHEADGVVQGLEAFAEAHPPVAPVFFAFRIMVGIGLLMIAVSWIAAWSLRRGRAPPHAVLRALAAMTYAGWIATLAGWYVTEIGRQPWLVYGLLAAADTVAPHAPAKVAGTLVAYATLYTFLLISYVLTLRYLATKPAKSLRMLQLPALSPVTEPR
ncbi:MAG TPA: cytochrome ubiquinol oxidase subunit I [Gammaproteobacteria bacterium]|nr:cytochrome ubiquinol oxidase subunit I [Gammaproteobacteria bacterium]